MEVYLTAIITSKPQHASALKALLLNLVTQSTKEEACLKYELHQSAQDENIFIFHEIWKDQAGLDLHDQQPHLVAFGKEAADLLAGPVVIHKTHKLS